MLRTRSLVLRGARQQLWLQSSQRRPRWNECNLVQSCSVAPLWQAPQPQQVQQQRSASSSSSATLAAAATGVMKTAVLWAAGTLAAFVGALYWYQDKLLYFPTIPGVPKRTSENPPPYNDPGNFNLPYDELEIVTEDGVKLHGWLIRQPSNPRNKPTVLFFHGNAGNIGIRLPNAEVLHRTCDCNIAMIDYRGYGESEGAPTEEGLQLDAEAALAELRLHPVVDNSRIFVFGRSLGGAVAIHLARRHQHQLAGVIVENTFLSIPDMVEHLYPILGLLKDAVLWMKWHSHLAVPHIRLPMLFFSGEADTLVPPRHMQQLHDLASGSRDRKLVTIPFGTHDDTWVRGGTDYLDAFAAFLAKHRCAGTKSAKSSSRRSGRSAPLHRSEL